MILSLFIPAVILEGRRPDRIHQDCFWRFIAGTNIEKRGRAVLFDPPGPL
jgi:hypothetical protein